MKITRRNVSYQLTFDELKQAHEEYLQLVDSAYNALCYHYVEDGEQDISYDVCAGFLNVYGFSIDEAMDKDSKHCILPRIIEAFMKLEGSYHDRKEQWEAAVEDTLTAMEKAIPIPADKFMDFLKDNYTISAGEYRLIHAAFGYVREGVENGWDLTAAEDTLVELIGCFVEPDHIHRIKY